MRIGMTTTKNADGSLTFDFAEPTRKGPPPLPADVRATQEMPALQLADLRRVSFLLSDR